MSTGFLPMPRSRILTNGSIVPASVKTPKNRMANRNIATTGAIDTSPESANCGGLQSEAGRQAGGYREQEEGNQRRHAAAGDRHDHAEDSDQTPNGKHVQRPLVQPFRE